MTEYIYEIIKDSDGVDCYIKRGEIVRCLDCKWFNDFGCAIRIVDDSDKPKDNDFCSFGERKETEDE